MTAPLDGIVVLDMTHVLAGPFAATQLADFGALVIKVERPGSGDDTRAFPLQGRRKRLFRGAEPRQALHRA